MAGIRADLALARRSPLHRKSTGVYEGSPLTAEAIVRLLDDVPGLLAEVEAAHRFEQAWTAESAGLVNTLDGVAAERDALRAENERLRTFDATSKARFAELRRQYLAELAEARALIATRRTERDAARAKVRAAELLHCWTNEDGRRFVFADDLATALGIPS